MRGTVRVGSRVRGGVNLCLHFAELGQLIRVDNVRKQRGIRITCLGQLRLQIVELLRKRQLILECGDAFNVDLPGAFGSQCGGLPLCSGRADQLQLAFKLCRQFLRSAR